MFLCVCVYVFVMVLYIMTYPQYQLGVFLCVCLCVCYGVVYYDLPPVAACGVPAAASDKRGPVDTVTS